MKQSKSDPVIDEIREVRATASQRALNMILHGWWPTTMKRLDHVRAGRTFNREEMNERR